MSSSFGKFWVGVNVDVVIVVVGCRFERIFIHPNDLKCAIQLKVQVNERCEQHYFARSARCAVCVLKTHRNQSKCVKCASQNMLTVSFWHILHSERERVSANRPSSTPLRHTHFPFRCDKVNVCSWFTSHSATAYTMAVYGTHTTALFPNNTTSIASHLLSWCVVDFVFIFLLLFPFNFSLLLCFATIQDIQISCIVHRKQSSLFVLMPVKKSDSYAKLNFYLLYDACKYLNANERTKPLQQQTVQQNFSIANKVVMC